MRLGCARVFAQQVGGVRFEHFFQLVGSLLNSLARCPRLRNKPDAIAGPHIAAGAPIVSVGAGTEALGTALVRAVQQPPQPAVFMRAGVQNLGAGKCRVETGVVIGIQHPSIHQPTPRGHTVNNIVYIVGAVVIIFAVLSFFGLR
jgi:hypothetical protein